METRSISGLQSLWVDSGLDGRNCPPLADLYRADHREKFRYYITPPEDASPEHEDMLAILCTDFPTFFGYVPHPGGRTPILVSWITSSKFLYTAGWVALIANGVALATKRSLQSV